MKVVNAVNVSLEEILAMGTIKSNGLEGVSFKIIDKDELSYVFYESKEKEHDEWMIKINTSGVIFNQKIRAYLNKEQLSAMQKLIHIISNQ